MDPRPREQPTDSSSAELFADYLQARARGEKVDIEDLCARNPDLAAGLRRLHEDWYRVQLVLELRGIAGTFTDRIQSPRVPEDGEGPADLAELERIVERLGTRSDGYGRYDQRGELARGGQGAILHVWDEDLRRELAMKVVLDDGLGTTARNLGRFLDEAHVTGQLEHPGIVPVHELGLDSEGRLYFTMKLVKGRDLRTIFDLVHKGREGWTLTRALGVMLKVCEAMAYAHSKGVVHRDLKPGNVMVGEYGEVYVMDWGLAQIQGRGDPKDVRVRPPTNPVGTPFPASAKDAPTPEDPLITMDGHVVGTPAFMSPEQALGRIDEMGPHSDVYSAGAMLYHLLSRRMPYVGDSTQVNNYAVWYEVQIGPPDPLAALAPNAPPELVAITEKAMERDPHDRYRDMQELERDLRAYLEGHVVQAFESGAVPRLRKWVLRNKALATASAAAVLLLVVGLITSLILKAQAETNLQTAKLERDNVLRLSALQKLEDLRRAADELWPPTRERIRDYVDWLEKASALVGGLQPDPANEDVGHYARLAALRARALPGDAADAETGPRGDPRLAELGRLRAELGHLTHVRDVRAGRGKPTAVAVPATHAADADTLARRAWPLVDPARTEFGREAEGLALANLALDVVEGPEGYVRLCDLRAWALFANGLDREAVESMAEALTALEAEGPESPLMGRRIVLEASSARLAAAIRAATDTDELLADREARVAALQAELSGVRSLRFETDDERWWHAQLEELVSAIEAFADEETGLVGGISPRSGWGVERRLAFARTLEAGAEEHAAAWEAAIAAIADRGECPVYDGLVVVPQEGLLPIGSDPDTGLWEFAHLQSGEPARRGDDGRLVIGANTGIVLVLLPGGSAWIGAQRLDAAGPNYHMDLSLGPERPVHEVFLSPFFLSKYEVTQAQWVRVTGGNPSYWSIASEPHWIESVTHPVEKVSWNDGVRILGQLGLTLPSEAQWEYAARAGTQTAWWTGRMSASLEGAENLGDEAALREDTLFTYEESNLNVLPWDDGYPVHAPVDSFRPNPFGFHHMLGNVGELCRDAYSEEFYAQGPRTDPVYDPPRAPTRVIRGNAYFGFAQGSRSSFRQHETPSFASGAIGLRPARPLDD